MKLSKEDCQSHKSYLLRKRSCKKKLRKWQTSIHGLFTCIAHSATMITSTVHLSCSLSPRYWPTRSKTNTSMRQWWSLQPSVCTQRSTRVTSQSWKKKSTGCSGLMHLIYLREFSLKSRGKGNTPSLKNLFKKRLLNRSSNGWKWGSEFQSKRNNNW